MPRRLASQVHLATSRLLKAGVILQPPAWYDAVLTYPPIPLPPRSTPPRPLYWREEDLLEPELRESDSHRIPFDLPLKNFTEGAQLASRRQKKSPAPRAQPIEYTEDLIRRQFFRDHPFEAFRSRSLVELDTIREEHPIQGDEWVRLSQHGRIPSSEEAIRFAAHLHEHHTLPISKAYNHAVAQFRSLRSEHYISTLFAINEAKFYGAKLAPNQLERGHTLTNRALWTWQNKGAGRRVQHVSMKGRFFAVWKGRLGVSDYWTRGIGYTRRWQKGMPPSYWPNKEEREIAKAKHLAAQHPVASAAPTTGTSKPFRDVPNPWKIGRS